MLSQKISKIALKIERERGSIEENKKELGDALELWKASHERLRFRNDTDFSGVNSDTINMMFDQIEPHYKAIYQSAQKLLLPTTSALTEQSSVANILDHEARFLEGMDKIVFQSCSTIEERHR